MELESLVPLERVVGGGRDQPIENDGLNHPVDGVRPLLGGLKEVERRVFFCKMQLGT